MTVARPFIEESAEHRVEVLLNGKAKGAIRILSLQPRAALLTDEMNPVSSSERTRVLAQIEEARRLDVGLLLDLVAGRVLEFRAQPAAVASTDGAPGDAIVFEDDVPHTDPVQGAEFLDSVRATARRYVVFPDYGDVLFALWVLFTYVHDAFVVSPILAVTAPEKRCGKSSVLRLLLALVRRPLSTSNISPAATYRVVQAFAPTLLIDEGDAFLRFNEELRGLLNSGHTKDGAYVFRTVGDDFEVRRFTTWCPKAIAAIGTLPETLADRSVPMLMRRKAPGERVERLRSDRLYAESVTVRRRATRWAADHASELMNADPDVPESLNDRQADNWRVLLSIAEVAGGDWPALTRAACLSMSGAVPAEEESAKTLLLADFKALFAQRRADELPTHDILNHLCDLEERPWGSWGRKVKRRLTGNDLAELLKPFGIRAQQIRPAGEKQVRGYRRADFADAFARYIPDRDVTDVTALRDNDLSRLDGRHSPCACDIPGTGVSACEIRPVTPVTTEQAIDGVIYHPDGGSELTEDEISRRLAARRAKREAQSKGA